MGYRDEYVYGAEFPRRRLYARVARAEQIGSGRYSRHSYEFDAVDVEISSDGHFDALFDPDDRRHFALVRVVTTEGLFNRTFGVAPQPGFWFSLDIAPTGKGPIAFHAQLTATGYSLLSRGTLQSATFLFSDDSLRGGPEGGPDGDGGGRGGGLDREALRQDQDEVSELSEIAVERFEYHRPGTAKVGKESEIKLALKSLGAAVSIDLDEARALAEECGFPQTALTQEGTIKSILASSPSPHTVSINDVGQASFATLLTEDKQPLVYFDVGWPVVFNGRTCPTKLSGAQSKRPSHYFALGFRSRLGVLPLPSITTGVLDYSGAASWTRS
ncbi:hypothetical protein [Mesorhizobium sp. L48C026A00]|uniref:hypothetical protein n=1 Tax=Mesorhizobium sp. L48C026A00 TaxID=1287182 RepID=UPI0003D00C2D|nr:hypothetical protein [Mesorhizobium sp. L48C026A00]ESZ10194.1 hypothetical protein X737_32340 [Mesorhizobium sp. L48C026A00]